MAFTEQTLELDNAHISNLFGQFDCYLKKLERAFGTQIIDRDGTVHIRGEQSAVAIRRQFYRTAGACQTRKSDTGAERGLRNCNAYGKSGKYLT